MSKEKHATTEDERTPLKTTRHFVLDVTNLAPFLDERDNGNVYLRITLPVVEPPHIIMQGLVDNVEPDPSQRRALYDTLYRTIQRHSLSRFLAERVEV